MCMAGIAEDLAGPGPDWVAHQRADGAQVQSGMGLEAKPRQEFTVSVVCPQG